ncbi:hypothetical protein BJX76DRAFT_363040 [Aspergillus varians]
MIFSLFLQIALVAIGLPAGTLAQNCYTNDSLPDYDIPISQIRLIVTNQDDPYHLDGCTNVTGDIYISRDYSGPFMLNGVTSFTGSITMESTNPSELSVPALTSIGGRTSLEKAFDLNVRGPELEVEIPALVLLGGSFVVAGAVSKINMTNFFETRSPISVSTTVGADIFWPMLSIAATIDIRGRISSIDLPALTEVSRIDISSEIYLPCTDALRELYFTQHPAEDKSNTPGWCGARSTVDYANPSWTPTPTPTFTPTPTPTPYSARKPLSFGAVAGVVFGSVAGLFFILVVTCIWRTKRSTRVVSGVRRGGGDEVRRGGGGGLHGGVHGGGGDGDGEDVPPPYSKEPGPVYTGSSRSR